MANKEQLKRKLKQVNKESTELLKQLENHIADGGDYKAFLKGIIKSSTGADKRVISILRENKKTVTELTEQLKRIEKGRLEKKKAEKEFEKQTKIALEKEIRSADARLRDDKEKVENKVEYKKLSDFLDKINTKILAELPKRDKAYEEINIANQKSRDSDKALGKECNKYSKRFHAEIDRINKEARATESFKELSNLSTQLGSLNDILVSTFDSTEETTGLILEIQNQKKLIDADVKARSGKLYQAFKFLGKHKATGGAIVAGAAANNPMVMWAIDAYGSYRKEQKAFDKKEKEYKVDELTGARDMARSGVRKRSDGSSLKNVGSAMTGGWVTEKLFSSVSGIGGRNECSEYQQLIFDELRLHTKYFKRMLDGVDKQVNISKEQFEKQQTATEEQLSAAEETAMERKSSGGVSGLTPKADAVFSGNKSGEGGGGSSFVEEMIEYAAEGWALSRVFKVASKIPKIGKPIAALGGFLGLLEKTGPGAGRAISTLATGTEALVAAGSGGKLLTKLAKSAPLIGTLITAADIALTKQETADDHHVSLNAERSGKAILPTAGAALGSLVGPLGTMGGLVIGGVINDVGPMIFGDGFTKILARTAQGAIDGAGKFNDIAVIGFNSIADGFADLGAATDKLSLSTDNALVNVTSTLKSFLGVDLFGADIRIANLEKTKAAIHEASMKRNANKQERVMGSDKSKADIQNISQEQEDREKEDKLDNLRSRYKTAEEAFKKAPSENRESERKALVNAFDTFKKEHVNVYGQRSEYYDKKVAEKAETKRFEDRKTASQETIGARKTAVARWKSLKAGGTGYETQTPSQAPTPGGRMVAPVPAPVPAPTNRPIDTGSLIEGLKIKGGANGQALAGGETKEGTLALAQALQKKLPGGTFTSFNDEYHKGTTSKHAQGLAMDYALKDSKDSPEAKKSIEAMLKESGARGYVQDEYLNPSSRSTGGHMHTQFNSAEDAAMFQKYYTTQSSGQIEAKALPSASEGYLNTNAVNSLTKTTFAANAGKPPVVNVGGGKAGGKGGSGGSAPPASRGKVKDREYTIHASQQTDFSGAY